eukprot:scaffold9.g3311.t1
MHRIGRAATAARSAASLQTRGYAPVDKVLKKVQEAAEKAKAAAGEAAQSSAAAAERLAKVRQQAAAAASTLGEKVQAATSSAQQLASATVEELVKQNVPGSTAKEQREGQQPQEGEQAGAEGPGGSAEQGAQAEAEGGAQQQQAAAKPSAVQRLRGFAAAAVHEMVRAVQAEEASASALRGKAEKAGDIQTATTSELTVSAHQPQQTGWQKQWSEMTDKLGSHPLFRRMRGLTGGLADTKVFEKGREVRESLRERWETSDSALVHRIQDATDSLFTESEQAKALREIRARDASFDMVDFLRHLRADVPAYLEGRENVIQQHCSPEMVERLTGIMHAQRQQGLIPDPTLLDTSEVELVDLKMLDDQPIVVVQFTCQQINCTRDNFGNVVEGRPDEVHRVYYYWAVQQELEGYVGTDGAFHPPRWQLRELLIRGMHHLL